MSAKRPRTLLALVVAWLERGERGRAVSAVRVRGRTVAAAEAAIEVVEKLMREEVR